MCERAHVCVAKREWIKGAGECGGEGWGGEGRGGEGEEGDRMHLDIDALPMHPAPPCTRAEQLEVCV